MTLLEYKNIKIFLQKVTLQIDLKRFCNHKVKNTVPWTYVINGEENVGTFYEKELQKTNQKEFRMEKVSREKVINYMLNGKVMIHLIVKRFI